MARPTPGRRSVWLAVALVVNAAGALCWPEGRAATVCRVPDTIAADLSREVTKELNAFIASVPDGATIAFPASAKYKIEGTILVADRRGLTFEGNGCLFRSFDAGKDASKKENYRAWRALRTRAHWRIRGGRDITIRNIEIHGAHPNAGRQGTYDPNREAQHGFDIVGVEGCVIETCRVHDVWGDGCYVGGKAERVVVRGCRFERTGRQGMAVCSARDVLIEDNHIGDSRRGILDIEPYGADWAAGDIRVIGNTFGPSRLLVLPMGGGGAIGMVLIANNRADGPNGTPVVYNRAPAEGTVRRGPFVVVNNCFRVGGSPAAGVSLRKVDGAFLAANVLTFPPHRKMTAVGLDDSKAGLFANAFPGAARSFACDPSAAVVAKANGLSEPAGGLPPAELVELPGGFAVRVGMPAGTAIAVFGRGTGQGPRRLAAFGLTTDSRMAWVYVEHGKVVESYVMLPGTFQYSPPP